MASTGSSSGAVCSGGSFRRGSARAGNDSGIATSADAGNSDANIQQLATNLYGDHVFAFQLTSVLLVVAVAGTVLLTRKWPRDRSETESSDA